MRVSYAVCREETFERLKGDGHLIQGRLYFIRDTGEIFRGTSSTTAEQYAYHLRVIGPDESFPNPGKLNRIYVKPSTGRVRMWCAINGMETYIDLSGSSGSADLADVWEAIGELNSRLEWKTV